MKITPQTPSNKPQTTLKNQNPKLKYRNPKVKTPTPTLKFELQRSKLKPTNSKLQTQKSKLQTQTPKRKSQNSNSKRQTPKSQLKTPNQIQQSGARRAPLVRGMTRLPHASTVRPVGRVAPLSLYAGGTLNFTAICYTLATWAYGPHPLGRPWDRMGVPGLPKGSFGGPKWFQSCLN